VDAQKAEEFRKNYAPKCDTLLAQIKWNGIGYLFYIPFEAQQRIFNSMGREKYLKLPKIGTNPRGVEISKEALLRLISDRETKSIEINWQRAEIEYAPYRWIEYWKS